MRWVVLALVLVVLVGTAACLSVTPKNVADASDLAPGADAAEETALDTPPADTSPTDTTPADLDVPATDLDVAAPDPAVPDEVPGPDAPPEIAPDDGTDCGTDADEGPDPTPVDTQPPVDTHEVHWGTATCVGIVDCVATSHCNQDAACVATCREAGTQAAATAYDSQVDCRQANCPGITSVQQSMWCMHQDCREVDEPCARTGSTDCSVVATCVGNCSEGEMTACVVACFEAGTYDAQEAFLALNACQNQHCAGLSDPQWSTCFKQYCSKESDACPL